MDEAQKLVRAKDSTEWTNKLNLWKAVIDLAEGKASAASSPKVRKAVNDVQKLWRADRHHVVLLCRELAGIKAWADASLADDALNVIWQVRVEDPLDEITPFLRDLFWQRVRLAIQAASPEAVSEEQFQQLKEIFDVLKDSLASEQKDVSSAWRIEYRLSRAGKDSADALDAANDALDLPSTGSAYLSYVRTFGAIVRQEKEKNTILRWNWDWAGWQAFFDDLNAIFAPEAKDRDLLGDARLRKSTKWVRAAVLVFFDRKRIDSGRLPPEFPQEAARRLDVAFRHLQDGGGKLPDDLKIRWALASLYGAAPDFSGAEKVLAGLDLSPEAAGPDNPSAKAALSLLFGYLDKRFASDRAAALAVADAESVLAYTVALLKLASFPGPDHRAEAAATLSEQEATAVGVRILEPALIRAKTIEASGALSADLGLRVAELYEAAWYFTNRWPGIVLPVFCKAEGKDWRPAVLDRAIQLGQDRLMHQRLVRLVLERARFRILQFDLPGAIKDAEAVSKDNEIGKEAHVVLAKAYYWKAQQAPSWKQQLLDLKELIDICEKLESGELGPLDKNTRMDLDLRHSCALVLRANYTRVETFKPQATDLHRAVELAKDAKALRDELQLHDRTASVEDCPELALGNAYEDLAMICDEEPATNYARAIKEFESAAERQLVKRVAYRSIGRCYQRIAMEAYLEPEDFKSSAVTLLPRTNRMRRKRRKRNSGRLSWLPPMRRPRPGGPLCWNGKGSTPMRTSTTKTPSRPKAAAWAARGVLSRGPTSIAIARTWKGRRNLPNRRTASGRKTTPRKVVSISRSGLPCSGPRSI